MLELAEQVAEIAKREGVELVLIGGMGLAAHGYVRGTKDVDLGAYVDPFTKLRALQTRLRAEGLETRLILPDDDDGLGGVLRVWTRVDEDGDPVVPVEIVNFLNPLAPVPDHPGSLAIAEGVSLEGTALRYAPLPELIALKLYAGGRRDLADVVELLRVNPDADLGAIRAAASRFGFEDLIEDLISEV